MDGHLCRTRVCPGAPRLDKNKSSIIIELWNDRILMLWRGGMELMPKLKAEPEVVRYADMFSAMGTEPRLRIMRALLAAHPTGMIAGDIGAELDIPPST